MRLPIRRVAEYARLITFDKRGTGLSERTLGYGGAEDRMDDIRAVMDAAGSERAAVIGLSEGGPLAILFAATYPERTTGLVLWNTYARGLAGPDYPIGLDRKASKEFIEHIASVWGTGGALEPFLGTAVDDEERKRAMARYERNAATPKMAAEVLTRNVEIDVRTALPAVERADARAPPPGRSGVALPAGPVRRGADSRRAVRRAARRRSTSAPTKAATTTRSTVIEEFLTGHRAERPIEIDRVLATVLFVDIVELDPSAPPSWAITAGASCSTRSAPRCGASSSATAVAR